MAQIHASSTYLGSVLGGTLLTSFGVGLSFTPLASAATAGVPFQLAGLASGVLNTSRQVGGSIGLAALATLATARTTHVARSMTHAQALTAGYDRAFIVAAAIGVVGLGAATAIPRPRQVRGNQASEVAAAAVE